MFCREMEEAVGYFNIFLISVWEKKRKIDRVKIKINRHYNEINPETYGFFCARLSWFLKRVSRRALRHYIAAPIERKSRTIPKSVLKSFHLCELQVRLRKFVHFGRQGFDLYKCSTYFTFICIYFTYVNVCVCAV